LAISMRTIGAVPSVIAAMNSAVRPCLLARFGLAPWSSSSRTFAASVGALADQECHRLHRSGGGGIHQRRVAERTGRVGGVARYDQGLELTDVVGPNRLVEIWAGTGRSLRSGTGRDSRYHGHDGTHGKHSGHSSSKGVPQL
jgi:hypothetical protein